MLPRPLANAIIVLMALILAGSFGAQFFGHAAPDPALYGVIGSFAGMAYAQRRSENGKSNGGKGAQS